MLCVKSCVIDMLIPPPPPPPPPIEIVTDSKSFILKELEALVAQKTEGKRVSAMAVLFSAEK